MSRHWNQQSLKSGGQYDVYPKADSASYRLGDTGDYGPDPGLRFLLVGATVLSGRRLRCERGGLIPFGDFDVVVVFHPAPTFRPT